MCCTLGGHLHDEAAGVSYGNACGLAAAARPDPSPADAERVCWCVARRVELRVAVFHKTYFVYLHESRNLRSLRGHPQTAPFNQVPAVVVYPTKNTLAVGCKSPLLLILLRRSAGLRLLFSNSLPGLPGLETAA